MPRKAIELNPLTVSRLVEPGLHFVGGIPGLALQVLPTGARTWVLRMTVGAKRRDMGLGGYPAVTLAQAREAAREARAKVRQGVDPIEESRAARSALKAAQAAALTFEQCTDGFLTAHKDGWKNAKHAQQWRNTLTTYAFPVMGSLLVRDIGLPHVLAALEPIWRDKTETASRLRGRIEQVLDWATVRGYRAGTNPARWRGHLDKLLPKPGKIAKVEHHAALPAGESGAFMEKLRQLKGMGARALEFAILTATRSGEVRGAKWAEFDLSAKTWTIPAERMKAGKEHRVPLSPAALALIKVLPKIAGSELAFTAPRGGALSDMTLTAVVRRMNVAAVPHGFRSTFRDWASERTNYPRDVAEMALAHSIGDKVEAAYRRGDLFDKRRKMMDDWAAFLSRLEQPGQVIDINSKRA
ncbi:tyrosine-type recombinase/integrase [Pseudomonas sp. NPDC087697]|uniref:tyrosine-type recombinase/integrase n=1 Tax=Pseudomonas sp. NPDC087697 TaxID=3364447 RepID=UPI00380C63F3